MFRIKSTSIISILLLISNHSISFGQEFVFRRQVDTIPVIINGVRVHSPFAGGFSYFSGSTFVDIDNDGDLDLFVAEAVPMLSYFGFISFYRNTGTPTNPIFTLEIGNLIAGYSSTPTFADLDDDGNFDLFVGGLDGNINFYRNTGTTTEPNFTLVTEKFAHIDVGGFSTPCFVDIDSDGDLDVFIGEADGNINFYRNTGTTTEPIFTLVTENFADIDVGALSTPSFADIDNDENLDLFVGDSFFLFPIPNPVPKGISFYRNTGTATQPNFALEIENISDIGAASPTFVDIDNDTDLDLFVGGVGGKIDFYKNTGTATEPNFTLATENLADIDVGYYSIPSLADIDDDGDLDLFVGGILGGILFYRNIGFLGDIDNDGRVDVADLIRVIDIILGDPPEPTDQERAIADVNGDGNIDVRDLIVIIDIILGIGKLESVM